MVQYILNDDRCMPVSTFVNIRHIQLSSVHNNEQSDEHMCSDVLPRRCPVRSHVGHKCLRRSIEFADRKSKHVPLKSVFSAGQAVCYGAAVSMRSCSAGCLQCKARQLRMADDKQKRQCDLQHKHTFVVTLPASFLCRPGIMQTRYWLQSFIVTPSSSFCRHLVHNMLSLSPSCHYHSVIFTVVIMQSLACHQRHAAVIILSWSCRGLQAFVITLSSFCHQYLVVPIFIMVPSSSL